MSKHRAHSYSILTLFHYVVGMGIAGRRRFATQGGRLEF